MKKISIKKGFNYFRYYVMDGTRIVSTSGEYATLEQCISSAIADFPELSIPDKTGKLLYEGLDYFEWNEVKMPPGFVGDGVTDDYFAFKELVDRAEDGSTIYLPGKTDFFISETVKIIDKGIDIIGRKGTQILCNKGAFLVEGKGDKCKFKYLSLHSRGGVLYHGFELRKVCDFLEVDIINFDGWGAYAVGDVTSPLPTDLSFCYFQQVNVNGQGHGAGGFYLQGGDSSTQTFFHCDCRDTKGVGFNYDGFLGSNFRDCQGHANKGGHYRAGDPNNWSTFVGCYAEGDSPLSYFGGSSQISGGTLAAGGHYILADYATCRGLDGIESRRFPSQYEMSQQILRLQESVLKLQQK